MPILEVEHICKSFEGTEVLKDISFSLEKSQCSLSSVLQEAVKRHCFAA